MGSALFTANACNKCELPITSKVYPFTSSAFPNRRAQMFRPQEQLVPKSSAPPGRPFW